MMVRSEVQLQRSELRAWIVTISAALFFFYIFIQMNFFSAIEPQLFKAFGGGTATMAKVSQMYFYGNVLDRKSVV